MYKYTKVNLLEFPTNYSYSSIEDNFFKTFFENRKETIDFLSKFNDRKSYEQDWLTDKLIYFFKVYDKRVFNLIQRFEVSKKLYSKYDSDFNKKESNHYRNLINYILFSKLLQSYFYKSDRYKKVIVLNALLKVDDIIISAKDEFKQYGPLAREVLEGELQLLKEFNDKVFYDFG